MVPILFSHQRGSSSVSCASSSADFPSAAGVWILQDHVLNLNETSAAFSCLYTYFWLFLPRFQKLFPTFSKFVQVTLLSTTSRAPITGELVLFSSLLFLLLTSNKHLISPEPPVWADSNCIVSLLRPFGCLRSICERAHRSGNRLLLHYFIDITQNGGSTWSHARTVESLQTVQEVKNFNTRGLVSYEVLKGVKKVTN